MENVTMKGLEARYKDLFPLNCTSQELFEAINFFKNKEYKRVIIKSNRINFKPIILGYLINTLPKAHKYPKMRTFNVMTLNEAYITGIPDENLYRLTDFNYDILGLTAGYSEPNYKSLSTCIGFLMNNYTVNNKNMIIYVKGSSMIGKDIENLGKELGFDIVNYDTNTVASKTNVTHKKPKTGTMNQDLF